MGKTDLFKFQEYKVTAGNISNSVSDSGVSFGSVKTALYIKINNDTSSKDMTIRLKIGSNKSFGDSITIKGATELILSEMPITAIDQSNASGSVIAFRYLIAGI